MQQVVQYPDGQGVIAQESLVEQLAAEIDKKLDRRLGAMERHINAVGEENATVAKQVAYLLRQAGIHVDDPGDGEAVAQLDETWQCIKCGRRLGYYNATEDTLRVRHKGLVMYFQPGAGGKVSIICTDCAELNTVEGTAASPPEGAG